ncbi:tripartite tricarboxylate transporter substrate binding protein [Hydrogenophaga sp. BPS33]|nr:tripartite tricarboxylate transporter substrate binding protein [Hydrogenophaga sp. BPS33]
MALAVSAMGAPHAMAQEAYPARPVTLLIPYTAGGGSDNLGRLMATGLARKLGGTFVVENKPGGSTNLGNELVARAKPDGYTLLLGQVTMSINPSLYKQLRYDVAKDFVPVIYFGSAPVVLVTSPNSKSTTLNGLMAEIKANPGKMNFGSGGVGTSVHLAGELFKSKAQVDMTHVAYRGSSQMVADLIGGQIQMIFNTAPSVVPFIKAGQLRAIAVTGAKRLADLPDVPTFAEAGMPSFDAPSWYGLMAPAGTPPAIVARLNQALNEVLKEPATLERLRQLGVDPVGGTSRQFADFMAQQQDTWAKVIRDASISIDE